jgi:hypothetical protein
MKFMLDPAVQSQDILLRIAVTYPSLMFSGASPNVSVAQPRKLTCNGQIDRECTCGKRDAFKAQVWKHRG